MRQQPATDGTIQGFPIAELATQLFNIVFEEHPGHQERADHGLRTLGSLGWQQVQREHLFDPLEEHFNGTITNDKFCMSRTGRLQLSWWRLPLRARETVTNGVESSSEGNAWEHHPQEETHEQTTMESSASPHGAV